MSEQEHESEPQASLIKHIEDLANVLQESSIGELELTEDGTEIIIKRQVEGEEIASIPQQEQAAKPPVKIPQELATKEDHSVAIVAPLSGVFYASPSPGLPPFVKIGDVIQSEQVVALIEAMKVFNEIRPDVTGRLTQVSVEGGSLVKKGDVLFRIDPS